MKFAIGGFAAVLFLTPYAFAQDVLDCDASLSDVLAVCNTHQGGAFSQVDHVVCINDFQYDPAILQPAAGETVAWINVEKCGDTPVEDAIVNQAGVGCDPTHWVSTDPETPAGEMVDLRDICSPHPGVVGSAAPAPPSGCGSGETNVRCHTFTNPGISHYTCFTNEGHTVLMHGVIAGQ